MDFFEGFIKYWVVLFACLGFSYSQAQLSEVDHWEMVVTDGQEWNYFPGISSPQASWNETWFDDSGWLRGASGIGYGDGDDQTIIDPSISLYMRIKFQVIDTSKIIFLVFYMDYDDGFVAYLNGTEIARANVSGNPPQYNTLAASLHEALLYNGQNPEEFRIDSELRKNILREGENVLAVQVHNFTEGSSDMTAIPFLSAGIIDTSRMYYDTPYWFTPPVDYSVSELPILSINTFNETIVDEPRIRAWLSIIDQGVGEVNYIDDPITGYDGWINIESRGESAQMFPKKSYSFETQDSLGENNNVSLLGMPEENDWILYGPYSDKTLIKNVLCYKLARDMGRYATRTAFCELFINGEYRGLYILMEKIKQDRNRVDIASLRAEDVAGDQLTGGYILRVDKVDANDYPPWTSYPETGINGLPIDFQYFDPDGWELQAQQREYIMKFILDFENVLNGTEYLDPVSGFKSYVDYYSFIDFLIINELSKNIDAYIYSTYLYKDRDSKGGKLHMGPVWDFNISFGNVDYNNSAVQTFGWMYQDDYRMYWFRRIMQDQIVRNYLNCRWHELRAAVFRDDRIFGYIDSLVTELRVPIDKNYQRWPVLGTYVWPNIFIGDTHEEEITHLKNWLHDRLAWMDQNIPAECVTAIEEGTVGTGLVEVYPNPFYNKIRFLSQKSNPIRQIFIYDKTGRLIDTLYADLDSRTFGEWIEWSGKNFRRPDLGTGLYVAWIELSDGTWLSLKLIKSGY